MPKVSAVTVHYVLKSLEQQTGLPMQTLIDRAGIDPKLFERDNARIDAAKLLNVFQFAVETTKDPYLALHIGESIPYQSLGLLGYLLVNTDTVGSMLKTFSRYQKLIGRQMKFHFSDDDTAYKMAVYLNENPEMKVPRYHSEVHLAALINIIRQVSGQPVVPHRVHFGFDAPGNTAEYERIFGPNLHFSQDENALFLLKEALEIPIKTANPSMHRFFEVQADAVLDDFERGSWYVRVKHLLLKRVGSEGVTIADTAEALGVSVRTLQYHLKSESRSYREALNSVRKKLAKHYVENAQMDFSTIAVMLDYAEPSIFFRAFKQWYGITPKQMRSRSGTERETEEA